MDALSLLALQIDWGADEALLPEPVSRLQVPHADATPGRAPAGTETAPPGATTSFQRASPRPGPQPTSQPQTLQPTAPGTAASGASGSVVPGLGFPASGLGGSGGIGTPLPPASYALASAGRPGADAIPSRGPVADARAAAAAAADLPALRDIVAAFAGCALRDTATCSVLPVGDPAAGIAIVGEVPDEDEDRAGFPFAGRAGMLLDRMLGSIGLDRDRVLLLPLIPWRPPGGRAPGPIELNTCAPFLLRALALSQPRFVLTMGSRPARLLADAAIRAGAGWRRPAIEGLPDETRVLAMRHPSYLLSHLPARRDAWADLIRLRHALDAAEAERCITAA